MHRSTNTRVSRGGYAVQQQEWVQAEEAVEGHSPGTARDWLSLSQGALFR